MWIKIDAQKGIIGPQSVRGREDTWIPYISYTGEIPSGKRLGRNYEDHQVTEILVDGPEPEEESVIIARSNRARRNKFLQETTLQGWGDKDYRDAQTAETLTAWDNYRQALRDFPTTHSEFSTRNLNRSEFPIKPT